MRRTALTACGLVFAMALLTLLVGCPRRQEIIEQTVGARGQDVAAEAEASYVPEDLLTWEMVTEIDPGFEEATAVAFDHMDALYVAGDEAVRKMSADGQVEWEMPVGGQPTCIALDLHGTILVGMRQSVEIYAQGGQLLKTLMPEGPNTWITSIAAWPDDRFVADAGNRRILRYDAEGNLLGEFAGMDHERGIPALSVPSPHLDVVAGVDGNLWMTNPGRRSIQVHSRADGTLLNSWDRRGNDVYGFGGCCNPTDITLLPDGRVVTAEKGLPRVKVYTSDGELQSVVVGPDGFLRSTTGIDLAANALSQVAVLDPQTGIVRVYEENLEETVTE